MLRDRLPTLESARMPLLKSSSLFRRCRSLASLVCGAPVAPAWALVLFAPLWAGTLGACSKGGADDKPSCRKLSDPDPDQAGPGQLPSRLYAELVNPSGVPVGVELDGSGGDYTGELKLSKCDEQGFYVVRRLVLVDANKRPVAIATHDGAIYKVRYSNGQEVTVSGTPFMNDRAEYRTAAMSGAVTIQLLAPQPVAVNQGDPITLQVNVSTTEECGLKGSTWWLASFSNGNKVSADQKLMGGTGSLTLRVPTTIAESVYVEGTIELKNGKVFQVRRKLTADKTYSLIDEKGGGITTATTVPVTAIQVMMNPDADKVAPQAVSFEADPPKVERCEKVRLALTLSDDRALPPNQTVKAWIGTQDNPKILSANLMGGTRLTGDVVLPQDAPSGVWFAFPEKVTDVAGNEAVGSLSGGKFTLSGVGTTPMPVMAATFIVPSPPNTPVATGDMGVATVDMASPPDMATRLAATLAEVGFTATVITREGEPVSLRVRWVDNSMPQILK